MFALAAIEEQLIADADQSHLPEVVERAMLADPSHWEGYYPGSSDEQRLARRYSYSDRLRYYWPDPEVHSAQDRLLANLAGVELPLPLISAHLPDQYVRIRRGELSAEPHALVIDHVRDVLRAYAGACDPTS